jgi:hypothetical protein
VPTDGSAPATLCGGNESDKARAVVLLRDLRLVRATWPDENQGPVAGSNNINIVWTVQELQRLEGDVSRLLPRATMSVQGRPAAYSLVDLLLPADEQRPDLVTEMAWLAEQAVRPVAVYRNRSARSVKQRVAKTTAFKTAVANATATKATADAERLRVATMAMEAATKEKEVQRALQQRVSAEAAVASGLTGLDARLTRSDFRLRAERMMHSQGGVKLDVDNVDLQEQMDHLDSLAEGYKKELDTLKVAQAADEQHKVLHHDKMMAAATSRFSRHWSSLTSACSALIFLLLTIVPWSLAERLLHLDSLAVLWYRDLFVIHNSETQSMQTLFRCGDATSGLGRPEATNGNYIKVKSKLQSTQSSHVSVDLRVQRMSIIEYLVRLSATPEGRAQICKNFSNIVLTFLQPKLGNLCVTLNNDCRGAKPSDLEMRRILIQRETIDVVLGGQAVIGDAPRQEHRQSFGNPSPAKAPADDPPPRAPARQERRIPVAHGTAI